MYTVKINEKATLDFTPVTINITVTSKDELMVLWHLFNSANRSIDYSKQQNDRIYAPPKANITVPIWSAINNLAEKLKIKYGN